MEEKVINLLGIRKTITLCRTEVIKGKFTYVYMEPITEEQEARIDKAEKYYGAIRFEHPNGSIIDSKNIYLYGEVNLNDKNDVRQIERLKLIDEEGNYIYSNFNYDKGNFITIDRRAKCYPTFNPLTWFMYCHCLIGKPKRIIVYRQTVSKK